MKITIVHGGQTGVDRGAFAAAKAESTHCAGFAPRNAQDEAGTIPAAVMASLRYASSDGLLARTKQNLRIAEAVLAIVPNRAEPTRTPGTRSTLEIAQKFGIPRMALDSEAEVGIARVIEMLHRAIALRDVFESGNLRVMVCGPRASLWVAGEARSFAIVSAVIRASRLAFG